MELKAYWNGYDVVAAHSEEEARAVVMRENGITAEDADGEGWQTLDPTKDCLDEDGKPDGKTVGQVLAESPEPRYLWGTDN